MGRSIVITGYNPQWPLLYEEEKSRILATIGYHVVAIDHVGSTAVPSLGAKPIIDIMVAVHRLADAESCIVLLSTSGYEYVPLEEAGIPERRYFRKGTPQARTHHLHTVERISEFWERHLLFRDFLRAYPEVVQQYYELKKELTAWCGSDREGYTEAKTSFIESVTARARLEHRFHQGQVH